MSTPAVAIIPARYGSTRFPGKPLADRTGKPLIQHVVEQVRQAKRINQVIVATDDQRIFDAVRSFDCQAVMTRPDHPNGTSRLAQVVSQMPPDEAPLIVNVQGDEPQIQPRVIDQLIVSILAEPPASDGGAQIATVASHFSTDEDPTDPNIVKVVVGQSPGAHEPARLRALYFSRSLIPFDRQGHSQAKPLKHVGIYAYRRDFLLRYAQLPPTPLELTEQLEQLRALEHGYPIAVIQTDVRHHGIDTPQQYEQFVKQYLRT